MERNEYGYTRQVLPENTMYGITPNEDASVQLGMVYAPFQFFRRMYEPHEGLHNGTIFEELYKPLNKGGCPCEQE